MDGIAKMCRGMTARLALGIDASIAKTPRLFKPQRIQTA